MKIRSTTVLCVRRDGRVALGCDGQVTVGTTVMKHNAKKIRRLHHDQILAGFAGATADAFTLFEKFESKLKSIEGISRGPPSSWQKTGGRIACFAAWKRSWPSPGVSNRSSLPEPVTSSSRKTAFWQSALVAPTLAAARGLLRHSQLEAPVIITEALTIAGSIDIYTNQQILVEELRG